MVQTHVRRGEGFNIAYDQNQWRRHHDDPAVPAVPSPKRRYYPGSLQELINIVKLAEAGVPKPEVRASGSHWALSHAAVTPDFIVETHDPDDSLAKPSRPCLNKTLHEVIPACLTVEARTFFAEQGVDAFSPTTTPDHSKFYLYHVEAGTRLYELYSRLDAGEDDEPTSLAASLPEYKGPWAMQTLGGAGGQTIGGAISTGTHGGDVHLPPIADSIQAIHLVGPGASHYWIERTLPGDVQLVDESLLNALYPDIKILRDVDVFNAAVLAVGRMGIIYSVVLRVVRQFALSEKRWSTSWSAVKAWVANPSEPIFGTPASGNRFMQVVINPNSSIHEAADHSCFCTTRQVAPLASAGTPPLGRAERSGVNAGTSHALDAKAGDFFNSVCESDAPVHAALDQLIAQAEKNRDEDLNAAALALSKQNFGEAATKTAQAGVHASFVIAARSVTSSLPSEPLGNTMGTVLNYAAKHGLLAIVVRPLAESLLSNQQADHSFTGISYAVMDLHDYREVGCSANADSLEVFLDASSPSLIAYVEKLFQRVNELESGFITGAPLSFVGYVSLRFMSSSRGLLAMQRFPRICAIEVAGFRAVGGTGPFLNVIEQDAIAFGGTVHWGQRNNLDMVRVEAAYGEKGPSGCLFRWRKVLSELTGNGRVQTFSTEFTRLRGLEVVQPLIERFELDSDGKKVVITWDATNNPPGTTARLEVFAAAPDPIDILPLTSLHGSTTMVVTPSLSALKMVVTYNFGGRLLADSKTINL